MRRAEMMAYQGLFLIPYPVYCWLYTGATRRVGSRSPRRLVVFVAGSFSRASPPARCRAGKLTEYFEHYGFQAIEPS